jgi:hypothetical protein
MLLDAAPTSTDTVENRLNLTSPPYCPVRSVRNALIHCMRRLLAISLLLFFGLPLVSPLFAFTADGQSGLAACCRRDGKHQCMGLMAHQGSGDYVSAIPRCCESFPRSVTPSEHHDLSFDAASLQFAEAVSHPAIHRQTEARARVALDLSRRKRGPPATRIS